MELYPEIVDHPMIILFWREMNPLEIKSSADFGKEIIKSNTRYLKDMKEEVEESILRS
jgi:hypothetical protein